MDRARRHLADANRNKGTAFTTEERSALGLTGRLPARVETLDEQATRSYVQLLAQPDYLAKYVYLEALHDRNEVLYYRLLTDHLAELLPVVYDPTASLPHSSHCNLPRITMLRRSLESA